MRGNVPAAIKWTFRPSHRRLHLDPSAGEGRKPPTSKLDANVHYPHCRTRKQWEQEPPSDGSREQEARLAPLVPRSGASSVDNGAVAVFTAINLILLRAAGDFSAARKHRLLTIVGVCHIRRFGPRTPRVGVSDRRTEGYTAEVNRATVSDQKGAA